MFHLPQLHSWMSKEKRMRRGLRKKPPDRSPESVLVSFSEAVTCALMTSTISTASVTLPEKAGDKKYKFTLTFFLCKECAIAVQP